MAANSDNKADLSVDNVHTPFGLTKSGSMTHLRGSSPRNRMLIDAGSRSHFALSTSTHEEV